MDVLVNNTENKKKSLVEIYFRALAIALKEILTIFGEFYQNISQI